jgi:hypothetical protein
MSEWPCLKCFNSIYNLRCPSDSMCPTYHNWAINQQDEIDELNRQIDLEICNDTDR